MDKFLLGVNVMACLVVGLFFLRFWRRTREFLFVIFAAAFWLMAINWALLAMTARGAEETRTGLYVIRLTAFVLILLGILNKNRSRA
jgi:hypothetical protein